MKKILLMLSLSMGLWSMGHTINYDDKFNEEERQEVNSNAIENTRVENKEASIDNIELETSAFIEKNGKNVHIKKVKRNSSVIYINRVINSNSSPRRDIVIKNPIPEGTEYIKGSAICQGSCTISYSSDGGETLTKNDNGNVNYIEFYFKTIPSYKEFRMGFRAVVK